MRLATIRRGHGVTAAARIDADIHSAHASEDADATATATIIDGFADLSVLLAEPDWRDLVTKAIGARVKVAGTDYAPVVPRPGKVICVGLNYAAHIKEMRRELPEYPTLFVKFPEALTGPYDDVVVPAYAADQLDWEGELAVVIGRPAYQVPEADAEAYVAGYTVMNDYTMRDYQSRTLQWHQGKTFEKTSGIGPFLVTDYCLGSYLQSRLDGEVMQSARRTTWYSLQPNSSITSLILSRCNPVT